MASTSASPASSACGRRFGRPTPRSSRIPISNLPTERARQQITAPAFCSRGGGRGIRSGRGVQKTRTTASPLRIEPPSSSPPCCWSAVARSTEPPKGPSTSVAANCTPDKLDTVRRQAHRRHRQARLPAVLRGRRSDQRQGLRERRRLRDRRPARLRRDRGRVDGGAVQRLLRPGPEGLRLRRQPDLDHPEARRSRSTSRLPTTRPTRPWSR